MTSYDVIGDVHGQSEKLQALLRSMGYTPNGRSYKAPVGRQAVFVGDLIDRGPGQLKVLEIVYAMVSSGEARVVLGNHEFNAIGYMTEDPFAKGGRECLRPNLIDSAKAIKNRSQHAAFLEAVQQGSKRHFDWISWFKTLPLTLDLGGIRVAHAWWDDEAVDLVNQYYWNAEGRMSDQFLLSSYDKTSPLKKAREKLTTGIEWDLPEGLFIEKDGQKFTNARLAVWRDQAKNLREIALVPKGNEAAVPDIPIPADVGLVKVKGTPVFIGHHWFRGEPGIESPKLACLDWSAGTSGPLVAYRWDGEAELSNAHFFWADKLGH